MNLYRTRICLFCFLFIMLAVLQPVSAQWLLKNSSQSNLMSITHQGEATITNLKDPAGGQIHSLIAVEDVGKLLRSGKLNSESDLTFFVPNRQLLAEVIYIDRYENPDIVNSNYDTYLSSPASITVPAGATHILLRSQVEVHMKTIEYESQVHYQGGVALYIGPPPPNYNPGWEDAFTIDENSATHVDIGELQIIRQELVSTPCSHLFSYKDRFGTKRYHATESRVFPINLVDNNTRFTFTYLNHLSDWGGDGSTYASELNYVADKFWLEGFYVSLNSLLAQEGN